jgi:signal transduction histidine kinase
VLDLGLTAAIEWQVGQFQRRSKIACALVMSEKITPVIWTIVLH